MKKILLLLTISMISSATVKSQIQLNIEGDGFISNQLGIGRTAVDNVKLDVWREDTETSLIARFGKSVNGKDAVLQINAFPDDNSVDFDYLKSTINLYSPAVNSYFNITATHPNGVIRFHTGGWNSSTTERLRISNTQVTVQSKLVVGGADVAEKFNVNSINTKPGMLVSIDPQNPGNLTVSQQSYDKKIVGVISGAKGIRAGMVLAQEGTIADGNTDVAIAGRVYCYASTSNGVIESGDFLTTSDKVGYAMKATDLHKANGAIIGKAMTSLEEGDGMVLILITLQ